MAAKKKKSSPGRKNASGRNRSQRKNNSGSRNTRTSGRKSTSSSGRRSSREQEKEYIDYSLYYEVILWIILAAAILLFISMLGMGGKLGSGAAGVIFGVFGIMGYLFPFFLFFLSAFLISNGRSGTAHRKAVCSILLFLIFCGLMQLILVGYNETFTLKEYYESGAQYHTGGGFIGGCLMMFFTPAIGKAGTWIVLLAMAVVFMILISQRSLMRSIRRHSRNAAEKARVNRERRRQWREREQLRRREEREQQEETAGRSAAYPENDAESLSSFRLFPEKSPGRRDNRFAGVTTATTLTPQSKGDDSRSGDMVQVLPPVTGKTLGSPVSLKNGRNVQHQRIGSDVTFDEDSGDSILFMAGQEPAAMKNLRGQAQRSRKSRKYEPIPEKTLFPLRDDCSRGDAASSTEIKQASGVQRTENKAGNKAAPGGDDSFVDLSDLKVSGISVENKKNVPAGDDLMKAESSGPSAYDLMKEEERKSPAAKAAEGASAERTRKTKADREDINAGIAGVEKEISAGKKAVKPKYVFPPVSLLKNPSGNRNGTSEEELRRTAAKLAEVFKTFGVNVKITNVICGPTVTRYELIPEMGIKVSRILSLQDDIMLNLAAADIRIEAPIPGKAAVGIEIPNKQPTGVMLRELIDSDEFRNKPSNLTYCVGKDIAGQIIVSDISRMPHLLIAGSTGSGKSVFINTLIMSIIYKSSPEDVKMIMIDPKVVELSVYNGIPHLYIPVVTDPKKAADALNWAVAEMTARYKKFSNSGVRDIRGYNKKVDQVRKQMEETARGNAFSGSAAAAALPAAPAAETGNGSSPENGSASVESSASDNMPEKMPQIVIIVDELADLMMVSSKEVEDAICRLAQLARAAGIHLVIATQRPSVDVITGLIKANMPSRIAFAVSSGVDSRTILDMNGAEKLLGNGDMLFFPQNFKQPMRVQGAFVSDQEVADVTDFLKQNNSIEDYDQKMQERMEDVEKSASHTSAGGGSDQDELFADAGRFLIEKDKASIGMLQRWFKIGFNRAARIMDQLSEAGVVGPEEGTKPRKILMSEEQFENYLEQNG